MNTLNWRELQNQYVKTAQMSTAEDILLICLHWTVIAGSFKSQLIDYFRGHIVFREAFG